MPDRDLVTQAIRASWSEHTTSVPDEWTPDNPARGQCDVSSFVYWEHFGGDLVLAEVFVDGVRTEHHYWNRIDGDDVDLTGEQFTSGEEIREHSTLPHDVVRDKTPDMRSELHQRIETMRTSVNNLLT